ncbi:uracil-DNA glycosylase [Marinicella sediminis]|uniref:Uracil-DNA glycosylase n=1 Tax=Marinicella sediminis TaxID=1792834 RepID=A0ABV7JBJ3_9GAMM|nr:uracil-DNA glycosylase [Marinicella sediminis]
MTAQLHPSWLSHLQAEFDATYMHTLRQFLLSEKQLGKIIYPPGPLIFNALNSTPLDQVKVVILGQDPYHGPGQAHGLSFSVPPEVKTPPSLVNIFKELNQDLGVENGSPDLTSWAAQGVLLLNSVLTVEQARPASHQQQGWERFTDQVIELISMQRDHVVFMLWGAYAQRKGQAIDESKHLLLKAPHPSPLSAHRGFLGCQHFSKCNEFLELHHKKPVDWRT